MKYFRTIFLNICLISIFVESFSQDLPRTENAFFLEILGNGGLYSINYERNLHRNIYCRIGFATFQIIYVRRDPRRITTIPLIVSYLSGGSKHHFELGGGFLLGKWTDFSESDPICDITSFIGYRYQSLSKGFLFRIGLTPFVSLNSTNYPDKYFISGGLSFGYHF